MTRSIVDLIERRSALSRGFIAERSPDPAIAERGLTRMGVLLGELGDPHLAYRTIHIAGSKGKGTTTHIIAALLTSLGIKTGRYTSPHLLDWNERIAVDDLPIPDVAFARVLADIESMMAAIERRNPELGPFNAFELLTAAAFVHFREQGCDMAAIEVGLGGRFDSTNHVRPLVSVITRIEEEHTDILGPSITDVAWNKAGIIKSNALVVVAEQVPAVAAVIAAEAEQFGASLMREGLEWQAVHDLDAIDFHFQEENRRLQSASLPGKHNLSNIGAALSAVEIAVGGIDLADREISDTLSSLRIPGRFERRIDKGTRHRLILDVAHTPESVAAFVDAAITTTARHTFPFVIGMLSDKRAENILAILAPVAGRVIFPVVSSLRAVPPAALHDIAARLGIDSSIAPSIQAALDQVPIGESPVLVTGSFGIVADCHRALSARHSFDT